jgi:hypothetical protein
MIPEPISHFNFSAMMPNWCNEMLFSHDNNWGDLNYLRIYADLWEISELEDIVRLKLLTVTQCRTQQEFDQFKDNQIQQNQQIHAHNQEQQQVYINSLPQEFVQMFGIDVLMSVPLESLQQFYQAHQSYVSQLQVQNGSPNANVLEEAHDEDEDEQENEMDDGSNSLSDSDSEDD